MEKGKRISQMERRTLISLESLSDGSLSEEGVTPCKARSGGNCGGGWKREGSRSRAGLERKKKVRRASYLPRR